MEAVDEIGSIDAALDDTHAAQLWSASGARWLTDPAVPVPGRLVRRVVGLVEQLDRRGAGLNELVAARGVGFFSERAALMGLRSADRVSAGGASRLLCASGDWFALSLARRDDWTLLPAWLESDLDLANDDEAWTALEASVRRRSRQELVDRAGLLGLPCAAVGEVTDGRPVIAERLRQAPPSAVAGTVVVNLAALWAGPLCADVLARLGARVITVESTRRPDGGRLARRFFKALHGRSESVALDLSTGEGKESLRRLLLAADVVIEGSRPRALEQMGLDVYEIMEVGPRVWLSITAHGREDECRHRTGFGDDAAAAGGLVGWVGDEPRFVSDAVADPLTGLVAALAAVELLEAGDCWLADVALARVARSAVGDWIPSDPGPIARPRARTDAGAAMPLGRDTNEVLRSLGLGLEDRQPRPGIT